MAELEGNRQMGSAPLYQLGEVALQRSCLKKTAQQWRAPWREGRICACARTHTHQGADQVIGNVDPASHPASLQHCP